MTCGDVVLIAWPFTDLSGTKLRPAVLVSNDKFNGGDDAIFVPISSVLSSGDPYSLEITKSHSSYRQSGLSRDSCIKWTKPQTLAHYSAVRHLGKLDSKTVAQLHSLINSLFCL